MRRSNRRKVVKLLSLNIPVFWGTPIVRAVVLPAHAATSLCTVYSGAGLGLDYFGEPPGVTACAVVMGDEVQVTHQGENNLNRREGFLSLDGQDGTLTNTGEGCQGGASSITARIVSISDLELVYEIDFPNRPGSSLQLRVPCAPSCVPFPPLDCP